MKHQGAPRDDAGAFFDSAARLPHAASGVLCGLDFAAKDLFDLAGHRTGAGNPDWLRTHAVATSTAPCLVRLADAGARLIGKTHTDELAFSLEGDNHHYGAPRNPACPGRLAGGSSSGSAAAVAAGLADFALGTDTGGSVRVPASFCGLFGFRPTHGAIAATGVVSLAPSYDTVGWFARDVTLLARVGEVLLPAASTPTELRRRLVDPALLALADAPVRTLLESRFAALGAAKVDAGLADATALHECYRLTQGEEIWQTHGAWVENTIPVFGPTIAPRFVDASRITAAEAAEARALRADQAAALTSLLGTDAILLLPAAPTVALPPDLDGPALGTFYQRALALGAIAGFAGAPQVVIPAGLVEGCPVGLSLVGPRGSDHALLALAARLTASVLPG